MNNSLGNLVIKQWYTTTIVGLMFLAVIGCGKENTANQKTGDIALRLEWQPREAPLRAQKRSTDLDVCKDIGITGIEIQVKNASGKILAASKRLPCTDHKARLDNIAPQSGCTVEVDGFINDQVQWQGEKKDVKVLAGKNTDPVIVTMNFAGEAWQLPNAAIAPAHGTANVPTDSPITITFSQAMIASTINDTSLIVTQKDAPVAGMWIYDPDTFEAIFQPDQELAIANAYTVTVTKDVMAVNGQTMDKEITTQFITTTVWYVDGESTNAGNGKSWEQAFQTIDQAISAADDGDQIWVKHGTYTPSMQIAINKPVELLGGFKGNETQHHQRDWKTLKTVVDGNKEHRCFSVSSDAVIDGFTITDGYSYGGAIYIDGVGPRIENCHFTGNSSLDEGYGDLNGHGSAVYINSGNPMIKKCTFQNNSTLGKSEYNSAKAEGGAIYNMGGSPTISACIFRDNYVKSNGKTYGGAITNHNGKDVVIIDCRFESNKAVLDSEGEDGGGGGAISNQYTEILISGCWFTNNIAEGKNIDGGAVSNKGSHATLQNCIFAENNAEGKISGKGGAIANKGSMISVTNCTFYSNQAMGKQTSFGGAISNTQESNLTIINSVIWANTDPYYELDSIHTDENSNANKSNLCEVSPLFGADFHLRAESPCIGIGNRNVAPAADIDGETLVQNATDVGADQFVDSDGDGMPNYWEELHLVENPEIDKDNDGLANLEEYHLGTSPGKAQQLIEATSGGIVYDDGGHQASDATISIKGSIYDDVGDYNAFLLFDISSISQVKNAALRLKLTEYNFTSVPVSFGIWSVDTTAATLAEDFSGKAGIGVFEDLGNGTYFGDFSVKPSENGTILNIQLNQAAVKVIQATGIKSGKFIIGIALDNPSSGHLSFGKVDETGIHQLVIDQE